MIRLTRHTWKGDTPIPLPHHHKYPFKISLRLPSSQSLSLHSVSATFAEPQQFTQTRQRASMLQEFMLTQFLSRGATLDVHT